MTQPNRRTTPLTPLTPLSPAPADSLQMDLTFKPLPPVIYHYSDVTIDRFLGAFLSIPAVNAAYLTPRPTPAARHAAGLNLANPDPGLPQIVPVELALRFAALANGTSVVRPSERAVTHLATLLYPCGLFLCAETTDVRGQPVGACSAEVNLQRFRLLDYPLRKLKSLYPAMGHTLAAALGQSYSAEDIDREQVSRIEAAVHMAYARLVAYWSPAAPLPRRA